MGNAKCLHLGTCVIRMSLPLPLGGISHSREALAFYLYGVHLQGYVLANRRGSENVGGSFLSN